MRKEAQKQSVFTLRFRLVLLVAAELVASILLALLLVKLLYRFVDLELPLMVVLVIISVGITLIFKEAWTLREGTIIAAAIFGPAMDFWKKKVFS